MARRVRGAAKGATDQAAPQLEWVAIAGPPDDVETLVAPPLACEVGAEAASAPAPAVLVEAALTDEERSAFELSPAPGAGAPSVTGLEAGHLWLRSVSVLQGAAHGWSDVALHALLSGARLAVGVAPQP